MITPLLSASVLILVIGLLGRLGRFQASSRLRSLQARRTFAIEFANNLGKFVNTNRGDREIYTWLLHRSPRLQAEMGPYAVMNQYRPPFSSVAYTNYQIIVNALPVLARALDDNDISAGLVRRLSPSLDPGKLHFDCMYEAIVRYVGVLDDAGEALQAEASTTSICLRNGARSLVLSPVYFLEWFGLINPFLVARIESSIVSKRLTALFALTTFVASVMTIFVRWKPVREILRTVWP